GGKNWLQVLLSSQEEQGFGERKMRGAVRSRNCRVARPPHLRKSASYLPIALTMLRCLIDDSGAWVSLPAKRGLGLSSGEGAAFPALPQYPSSGSCAR